MPNTWKEHQKPSPHTPNEKEKKSCHQAKTQIHSMKYQLISKSTNFSKETFLLILRTTLKRSFQHWRTCLFRRLNKSEHWIWHRSRQLHAKFLILPFSVYSILCTCNTQHSALFDPVRWTWNPIICCQNDKKIKQKRYISWHVWHKQTFPGGMILAVIVYIVAWSKQKRVYHLQAAIFQALVFP